MALQPSGQRRADGRTISKSTAVTAFYTPSGPRHHDGIRYQQSKMYQHLYQQNPLQWGYFNPESTEETYVLTRGPQRNSRFELGLCDDFGYPQFGVTGEMASQKWVMGRTQERSDCGLLEEEYDVDAQVKALEWGQQDMKRDLKEVILDVPDMVIRALRVEQEAQLLGAGCPLQPAPQLAP
ncbi:UNVERIFIED_CONTAM: hypothetical protein K2H54_001445 [Gekko kuhli]